jgi:hypothetical protein
MSIHHIDADCAISIFWFDWHFENAVGSTLCHSTHRLYIGKNYPRHATKPLYEY